MIHNKDMFAQPEMADEKAYYKGAVSSHARAELSGRDWSAGMAVYDISVPDKPRQIGFMPVEGAGLHRIWYVGGRWAYASALLDGFTDYMLITIDMQNPEKPLLAGRFWLPGMNAAAGETPDWPLPKGRFGLHHPIVHGDIAYCSWRDACLAIVDVSDRHDPRLIARKVWSPPFGGGTHNALPLPAAIFWSLSMKPCSITRKTASSRSGSSTMRSGETRSALPPARRPTRPTILPSAVISGLTTSTKTAPGRSSAKS